MTACDPRSRLGAEQEKSEFFRTVGKIGDIEAINNVNSNIGEGLRGLETVSNQIRTGGGAPKIFKDALTTVEAGANAVYVTVGIDPNAANDVGRRFNPAVLNRAQGQAEQIYERVRQGNFEIRDVPEAIQDLGNLSQLIDGVFTNKPGQDVKEIKQSLICDPSPWATDLIKLAPKHKFMFVVEFVFTQQYQDRFKDLDFAFMIKRTTRPNVQFEYEDINYYNFRTKVLKRSELQPMTMTFYDDMLDNALKFYTRYLQIISPIARSVGDGTSTMFEESGMSFSQDAVNSASINAVGDSTATIIDYCNLYHIIHAGRKVDVYRMDNPRIQTLTLDDLDMVDGSTGTEVTIEFNYDGLNIAAAQDIRKFGENIKRSTGVGLYPITLENLPADEPTTTKEDDVEPATATPGPSPEPSIEDRCSSIGNSIRILEGRVSLFDRFSTKGQSAEIIANNEAVRARNVASIADLRAQQSSIGCGGGGVPSNFA